MSLEYTPSPGFFVTTSPRLRLEMRPAGLGRHPEDVLGDVLVSVLRSVFAPLGEERRAAFLEASEMYSSASWPVVAPPFRVAPAPSRCFAGLLAMLRAPLSHAVQTHGPTLGLWRCRSEEHPCLASGQAVQLRRRDFHHPKSVDPPTDIAPKYSVLGWVLS